MGSFLYPVPPGAERAELVRLLIETGAFLHSDKPTFKLASGGMSDFYINLKGALSHAPLRHLVGTWIYRLVAGEDLQGVGGLVFGACPIANAVSDAAYHIDKRQILSFIVRKSEKGHGLGKMVEGASQPGDRVLIVDDVVTSGGSTIEAIQKSREAGLEVVAAIAVVDRQERQGRRNIETKGGVPFSALCTRDDLIAAFKAQPSKTS
jgi:orotate phosphoribosyltransferase